MNTKSIKKSETKCDKSVTKKAFFDDEYFFRSIYLDTPPISRFKLKKPTIHSEDEIAEIREFLENREEREEEERDDYEEKEIDKFTEELIIRLFQIWYYIQIGRNDFDYSQLINIYPSELKHHIKIFGLLQEKQLAELKDLERVYGMRKLRYIEYSRILFYIDDPEFILYLHDT